MKLYETVNCIICDSNELDSIVNKGQFGLPTNVCICKNCGLSFLNPRWDEDTYFEFYKNEYDKYYRNRKITHSDETNPSSYFPILKRLASNNEGVLQFPKILDIGSGDGSKLAIFIKENVGQEYYAIEPSMSSKEILNARGIKFISNDVNSNWTNGYNSFFDLVIMRHVLEHFLQPDIVLERISEVLKEDGLLYIAVPNSLKPKPPLSNSFFRVVHTYYFSKTSLANLLYKTGYEIINIQEGDKYHQELFVIAKKTNTKCKIEINKKNYEFQKAVYKESLERESAFYYKLKFAAKNTIKSIIRKVMNG